MEARSATASGTLPRRCASRFERQKVPANKNSLDSYLQSFAEISSAERRAEIMKGWEIAPMMSSAVDEVRAGEINGQSEDRTGCGVPLALGRTSPFLGNVEMLRYELAECYHHRAASHLL